MTHYRSAVDLTVGCIIVQRRHLSETSGSGRHNSSSQNGLIKLREVFDSTREMENNRLIKNLRLASEKETAAAVCVGSGCRGAARVGVGARRNVLDSSSFEWHFSHLFAASWQKNTSGGGVEETPDEGCLEKPLLLPLTFC